MYLNNLKARLIDAYFSSKLMASLLFGRKTSPLFRRNMFKIFIFLLCACLFFVFYKVVLENNIPFFRKESQVICQIYFSPLDYRFTNNNPSTHCKKGIIFFNQAETKFFQGQFNLSLEKYEEALKHFKLADDLEGQALCLCRMAECYESKSSLAQSADLYVKALKIAYEVDVDLLRNIILRRYVRTLILMGRFEEANSILKSVRSFFSNTGKIYEICHCYLDEILSHLMLGNFEEANALCSQTISISQTYNFPLIEAEAMRLLSQLEANESSYPQSEEHLFLALQIFKKYNYRLGEANVLADLGWVIDKEGDTERSINYLEEAHIIYDQLGNDAGEKFVRLSKLIINNDTSDKLILNRLILNLENSGHLPYYFSALILLGNFEFSSNNNLQARYYLEKGLDLTRKKNSPYREASVLILLGEVERVCGHYDVAETYLQKALDIGKKLRNIKIHIDALIELGINQFFCGKNLEAFDSFQKSLTLSKKNNDLNAAGKSALMIGFVKTDEGDIPEAEIYFHQAQKYLSESKKQLYLGESIYGQARLKVEQGFFEEAELLSTQGLTIFDRIKNDEYIAKTTLLLAYTAYARGNHHLAHQYVQKTYHLSKKINNLWVCAKTLNLLALINIREGNFGAAQLALEKAFQTATQRKDDYLLAQVLYHQSIFFLETGDYHKTLDTIKKALEKYAQSKNGFLKSKLYFIQANVFIKQGLLNNAKFSLDQAEEIANRVGCNRVLVRLDYLKALYELGQGNINQAIFNIEKAIKKADQLGNPQHKGYAFLCYAKIRLTEGNFEKAKECGRRALEIFNNISYKNGYIEALQLLGQIALKEYKTQEAKELLDQCRVGNEKFNNKVLEANYLQLMGDFYFYEEDLEKAQKNYEMALHIYRFSGHSMGMWTVLQKMGDVDMRLCRFHEAVDHYTQSQSMCESIDYKIGLIKIFSSFGTLYKKQNSFKNADIFYNKALKLSQDLKLLQEEGIVLCKMAKLDASQQQWNFAKHKYEKAIHLFNQTNNLGLEGIAWVKLGVIEKILGNYGQALTCFQSAQKILLENPHPKFLGITLHQLGAIYVLKKNYKKGKEYYQKSQQIFLKEKIKLPLARVYISFAALSYKTNELDQSIQYLQKALHIFKTSHNPFWEAITALLLSNVYRESGDLQREAVFLEMAKSIQKKIGISIRNGNVLSTYDFKNAS